MILVLGGRSRTHIVSVTVCIECGFDYHGPWVAAFHPKRFKEREINILLRISSMGVLRRSISIPIFRSSGDEEKYEEEMPPLVAESSRAKPAISMKAFASILALCPSTDGIGCFMTQDALFGVVIIS